MTILHRYLNSCTPLVACKKENEKYKIIVLLLFKCLLGTALEYLSVLLERRKNKGTGADDRNRLVVPKIKKVT